MLHWYPYVPVGGEMAVNCAILSYDGTVFFGFSGDVHAAPDLRRLEQFLKASYVELRDAIRPLRKKSARPKQVRTKAQATSKLVPAVVHAPIAPSIPSPAKSARAPRATAVEEKVLTQLIA
jgi:WS/DGAT C-terminal domain